MKKKLKVKSLKLKVSVFIFSLFTLHSSLFTVVAFAVGGGEDGEQAFAWNNLLWPVINFAVLVFVLVKFGRKPFKEYFQKRTELIEKSLKEASEAKELAKKTLDEVRERLNNTDKEINDILEAAKKAGEKEKEALIAEGERMKEKILEQAGANIEFELEKAKKSIKSEAALMALELAEKQIKEQLVGKEQERLINEYIEKLEEGN